MTAKKDEPVDVEEFDATGDTEHFVLTVNGVAYRFDVQQALALRRAVSGAVINLNF